MTSGLTHLYASEWNGLAMCMWAVRVARMRLTQRLIGLSAVRYSLGAINSNGVASS
jgi:hypothetical protein